LGFFHYFFSLLQVIQNKNIVFNEYQYKILNRKYFEETSNIKKMSLLPIALDEAHCGYVPARLGTE